MNDNPSLSAADSVQDTQGHGLSLGFLTLLFFAWGFITCLNDILIPHLKNVFDLNYTQAVLIQFCFFGAYFLVSLPAGYLLKRLSYQTGIVIGLFVAAIGCLGFIPASEIGSYSLFLLSLFVLASGITILQVAANPYVTLLGPAKTASSRLTMTQAFNSLGTTVAPFFGGALILSATIADPSVLDSATLNEFQQQEAQAVQIPYTMLASALMILAITFWFLPLPQLKTKKTNKLITGSAWQHKHLVLGAIGIFVYVGAEVSIGSFLVNFLGEAHIANMPEAEAAKYIAYYWGGAMVGRFAGAILMQKIAAGKLLAFNGLLACLLISIAITSEGSTAMWAILAVGLCNSIMFPTIFSLALKALGAHTTQGSGILCLAIVGGAIIPVMQGAVADILSLQLAFIVPLLCYVYIVFYGLSGSTPKQHSLHS